MANIMIQGSKGAYVFYLPKRDLEDDIVSMEFDTPEKWGGEIKLNNGGTYYIEPQAAPARLPISLRARSRYRCRTAAISFFVRCQESCFSVFMLT